MPKDIQIILLEAAKEVQEWQRKESQKVAVESLELLRKRGMEVYQLPRKERERWKKAGNPVCIEIFLKRVGEKKGRELLELAEKVR